MPELFPFIFLIIVALPIALSTVLVLCVDLGTDMIPAISIAYEEAELDIMVRKPRSKDDHLANARLYYWAYMLEGWVQTFGCFVCFFTCFSDFGFPMSNAWFLNFKMGTIPEKHDTYDPDAWNLGNSNLKRDCTVG
jgi:sodium/potassium-transporting ATPase subunit alpha